MIKKILGGIGGFIIGITGIACTLWFILGCIGLIQFGFRYLLGI